MAVYNKPIPLKFNCGTALRMLQMSNRAKHRGVVHRPKLQADFLELFDIPTYEIPTSLKGAIDGRHSEFDKNCDKICSFFYKKWYPATKRVEYTATFSIENWKLLIESKKSKHTLSNCDACYKEHENLQKSFPSKPLYTTPVSISVNLPQKTESGFTKREAKDIGRRVLKDLDNVWQESFGQPITPTLPKILPEAKLVVKKTKTEKKKRDRTVKRAFVKEVNSHLAKNATLTVLAEAESVSSLQQKTTGAVI